MTIMKTKDICLLIILFFCLTTFSQNKYLKGVFTKLDGNKQQCFILNKDWKNPPSVISYKLLENDKPSIISTSKLSEFYIDGIIKFRRFTDLAVDLSSDKTDKLTSSRELSYVRKNIMLEVLVEGSASLYKYEKDDFEKYFFETKDKSIEQLAYKIFLKDNFTKGYNLGYLYQFKENLKCNSNQVTNVDYNQDELINFFVNYNSCINSEVDFKKEVKKSLFKLHAVAGLTQSSLSLSENYLENGFTGNVISNDYNFGSTTSFKIGIELELMFTFNNYKWSYFIQPTYTNLEISDENNEYDASYIETYTGIRHHFYLNDNSKLFLDAGVNIDKNFNSTLRINGRRAIESSSKPNFQFGFGYSLNKLSLSANYSISKNITQRFENKKSQLNTFSLNFKYQFL